MRKFLIAATILIPFAAFADQPGQNGTEIRGNLAFTAAGSAAGVQSQQGTMAGSMVKGDGLVVNGAVAGNYTAVDTSGSARAGQGYAKTQTKAEQTNIGGTITGGFANEGRGWGNTATGMAGGEQSSQATGGSVAAAADLGGFVKVEKPAPQRPTRPGRH